MNSRSLKFSEKRKRIKKKTVEYSVWFKVRYVRKQKN